MSKERPAFAAQWIGVGVAVGAGLGVVFGNIAIGAGAGVALGMVLAVALGQKKSP
jgi:hypothetical protein